MWLAKAGPEDPYNAGAGAYAYQDLMGLVCYGWMWLKMAKAAEQALAAGTADKPFYETKLMLADFYARRELPGSGALRAKVEAGAETVMRVPEMAF